MIRRTTTICWGVAIVLHLILPAGPLDAAPRGPDVPVARARGDLAGQTPAQPPVPQIPSPPAAPPSSGSQPATSPAAEQPAVSSTAGPDHPAGPQKPAGPYERAWVLEIDSPDPALAVAVGTDRLVLAGGNRPLEARALDTGAVMWTGSAGVTSLVLHGRQVFGVSGARLQAVSLDTGQQVWSAPLDGPTSGPAVMGEVLVVSSGPELRAYRTADGSLLWRQSLPAPAARPPIAAQHLVVIALTGNVIAAFHLGTGTEAWRTLLDSAPSPLAADAERIFFGTASGLICAVPIAGGEPDWCFRTAPVPSAGAPVIHGGAVFLALFDNTLRAFAADGGTLIRLETLPARPAAGPFRVGDLLAVPLTTSAFALLPLEGQAPVLVISAFDQVPGPSLRAAAASVDGGWLAAVSTDPAGRVWLAAYRRKPAAPAPASK